MCKRQYTMRPGMTKKGSQAKLGFREITSAGGGLIMVHSPVKSKSPVHQTFTIQSGPACLSQIPTRNLNKRNSKAFMNTVISDDDRDSGLHSPGSGDLKSEDPFDRPIMIRKATIPEFNSMASLREIMKPHGLSPIRIAQCVSSQKVESFSSLPGDHEIGSRFNCGEKNSSQILKTKPAKF